MVVSTDLNGIIANSEQRWAPFGDQKFFKEKGQEIGNLIIGEATMKSLLEFPSIFALSEGEKQREWYVLSLNNDFKSEYPNIHLIPHEIGEKLSVKQILEYIKSLSINEVVIAGGEGVYEFFKDDCDEYYITVADTELTSGRKLNWLLDLLKNGTIEFEYPARPDKNRPSGRRYKVKG